MAALEPSRCARSLPLPTGGCGYLLDAVAAATHPIRLEILRVAIKRPKSVTMATIAQQAGVARTTVSFILSGHYRERGISEKTAERVRAIVEEMQFVPNETARSLSRRRTGLIGIFLPGFNSSWGEAVVQGIRARLFNADGYVPLIASQHDEADWEEREIKLLIERDVEAIVCCPTVKTENYRRIMDRGIPLVFIGHRASGLPDASFVAWDGVKVAAAAVRHLISKGRRRIAFLGRGHENPTSSERYLGYRQAMLEAGLELREDWRLEVPDYFDPKGIVRSAFKKKDRPDALLCDLWLHALHTLETLDEIPLDIPKDVAVLALGDSLFCRHRRINLSTVVEPAGHIGQLAAEIALSLIQKPDQEPIQRLIGDYVIEDRGTT
ncbi:LacI family DNA-binding transcriptional regulator [bacterium]|nr:LacI family DNA-binding transcriptional regulator [bacterium]